MIFQRFLNVLGGSVIIIWQLLHYFKIFSVMTLDISFNRKKFILTKPHSLKQQILLGFGNVYEGSHTVARKFDDKFESFPRNKNNHTLNSKKGNIDPKANNRSPFDSNINETEISKDKLTHRPITKGFFNVQTLCGKKLDNIPLEGLETASDIIDFTIKKLDFSDCHLHLFHDGVKIDNDAHIDQIFSKSKSRNIFVIKVNRLRGGLNVVVKSLGGGSGEIEANPEDSVADFKKLIKDKIKTYTGSERLVTGGRLMEDSKKLKDYLDKDGNLNIYLVARLRGGV